MQSSEMIITTKYQTINLLREVLMCIWYSRKASTDVIHRERHLKMGLGSSWLEVWVLKVKVKRWLF